MGFSVELFVSQPDPNLVCSICHDVFEEPVGISCGHAFCKQCLSDMKENSSPRNLSCPICRCKISGKSFIDNFPLKRIILELPVKCCFKDEDGQRNRRRRLNNGEGHSVISCEWSGTLQDWIEQHRDECLDRPVECSVEGCTWTGLRLDLEKHMSCDIVRHVNLLTGAKSKVLEARVEALELEATLAYARVNALEDKLSKKEKELQASTRENTTKLYVDNFCRKWIEHKPDALKDFVVYRDQNSENLLCFVPGPDNTSWEGGLFPVLFLFHSFGCPPKCKFPKGFHHVNVYSGGTVCLSTLNEVESWTPDITIPEQLFGIQQLLNHPNPDSPAQAPAYKCYTGCRDEYEQKAKEQARQFHRSGNFVATAQEAFGGTFGENSANLQQRPFDPKYANTPHWLLVDDGFEYWKNANLQFKNSQVRKIHGKEDETSESLPESTCPCSCCSVGKSFWDQKGEMRFMFGSGG
jgi:ubiquitin-conjugating enzyme E2 I